MANDIFSGVKKVSLDAKKENKKNTEPKTVNVTKQEPENEDIKAKDNSPELQKEEINKTPDPQSVNDIPKETPKPKSTRGRKPLENPMERDYVSVNVGDGVREDLEYLCRKHAKQTGKKSVGLGTYIRYLIEQDIARNKKYLTAIKDAEAFFDWKNFHHN